MSGSFFKYHSKSGLAAVELAIIISVFLIAAILFGSLFTKVRVADRQNEYLYTFNSLPNPNVYQYGLEGELAPKTPSDILTAVKQMHTRIKFGTRGGESCVMAFRLNMNAATHVSGCDTAEITGADTPIHSEGTCNCDPSQYAENIKNSRNPECFDPQIVFVSYMPADSADSADCKVFQIFPGSTKKFARPFIPIY